jgi:VCBS repeat-containing protein
MPRTGTTGRGLSVVDVPASLPAGVSYDAAARTFSLDPANPAFQSLAAGQSTTVMVEYGVSDGTATTPASVSWTLTGTNDAPAVTGAVSGSATEDGAAVSLSALQNASDGDDGTSLSVVDVPASLPAGVSYDAAARTFSLDPANPAYQSLAAGQSTTVTVEYGVSDGTATTPASVSWTLTGTNDAPANLVLSNLQVEEGIPGVTVGRLSAADDRIEVSGSGFGAGQLYAGMDVAEVFGSSSSSDFNSESEVFHFDTSTCTLWFDADGTGSNFTQQAIVTLQNQATLLASDILIV